VTLILAVGAHGVCPSKVRESEPYSKKKGTSPCAPTLEISLGVYEGRGQLSKALKNLNLKWVEVHSSWDDEASKHFEEKFIFQIEMDLKNAVSAMDHMAVVLSNVRRDCQ
jgi:hypothetical protein